MDVKLIRMSTGEDLIAEVVDKTTHLVLKNPCIVLLRPTEEGAANISITHWVPYAAEKTFELNFDHIIFMIDPADDLLNNYKAVFSPLIVPKTQSIMTSVK
jgi:hypothetical protein